MGPPGWLAGSVRRLRLGFRLSSGDGGIPWDRSQRAWPEHDPMHRGSGQRHEDARKYHVAKEVRALRYADEASRQAKQSPADEKAPDHCGSSSPAA